MYLWCVCRDSGPMTIETELGRFEAELEAVIDRARECV